MLTSLITGWILRFTLGPSLFVSPVRIFCNHPTKKSEPFDRNKYNELKWNSPSGSKIDRHDVFAEVHINTAGSFNYYFTADGRFVQDIYLSFCFSKIKTLTLLKWTNFTIPCIEKMDVPSTLHLLFPTSCSSTSSNPTHPPPTHTEVNEFNY